VPVADAACTRVACAGATLAVRRRPGSPDEARRRAVLLLHGWPGTHRDWDRVFELLCAEARWATSEILCPDLRGFGESQRPEPDPDSPEPNAAFSPAAHIADLEALLRHYGAREVIVAGYDLGANLAQRLARASGNRCSGLVLCDPVHPAARRQAAELDLSAELWYQALHLMPWSAKLIGHDRFTVETYLRHFYTHWWGEGKVEETHFQELVDVYSQPGAFEASIGWYRSRARGPGGQVLQTRPDEPLSLPVEILWGELDPVTPVALASTLSESFSDFHLRRLATVGHFAPLEAPDELLAAFNRLAAKLRS
jgi:pimeloyl-ACP methyl ester carboxylesterase